MKNVIHGRCDEAQVTKIVVQGADQYLSVDKVR
jgi:hypothetical protein